MAKKKSKPIEPEVTEAVIEEEIVTEEIVEEVANEPIEEAVEEVAEEVINEPVVEDNNSNQFIYTQLKMINKMNNPAKARRLAERVLRNRKR